MGTNHRVEAVNDKQGDESSKHLTKSASSSSSSHSSEELVNIIHGNNGNANDDDDKPLGKSQQPNQVKSSTPFRVSFVSSNELSTDIPMPAGGQGYVPNRIPSSIFGKPATPMDWSTASNESLFSIHVGNGSFSKDQFFMLYKSGELTKLDEQIIAQGNVLPSLKELEDMAAKNENIEKGSGASQMSKKTTMAVETSEEVEEDDSHIKTHPAGDVQKTVTCTPTLSLGVVSGKCSQEKKFPAEVQNSPTHSISGLSDVSNNSTLSFAFPVLSGTDAGRVSSENGDQNNKGLQTQSVKQEQQQPEKKQSTEELQPQTPVTPRNASNSSWFSWFYCCRSS
ncbi:hypothetical protein DITRI_Ditri09bG0056500 [Diplodiscus trichospermus]